MANGKIQQRIDPSLQEEVELILKTQGIRPSQAIQMFYVEIKRRRSFPFLPLEVPNKRLEEDLNDAKKGIGIVKYNNKRDFFNSLKKL